MSPLECEAMRCKEREKGGVGPANRDYVDQPVHLSFPRPCDRQIRTDEFRARSIVSSLAQMTTPATRRAYHAGMRNWVGLATTATILLISSGVSSPARFLMSTSHFFRIKLLKRRPIPLIFVIAYCA